MKKRVLVFLTTIALSACATPASRWLSIKPGETRDHVFAVMGDPNGYSREEKNDRFIWNIDAFAKCDVLIDDSERVIGKSCQDDSQARDQARAQAMSLFLQMQRPAPQQTFTPVQPYQIRTPAKTKCTTNYIGGTGYMNCNSY